MPVTFKGLTSATDNFTGNTFLDFATPTGSSAPLKNDLILISLSVNVDSEINFTWPNGFIQLANIRVTANGFVLGCAYKISTGDEPSTFTVNYNTNGVFSGNMVGTVSIFSGNGYVPIISETVASLSNSQNSPPVLIKNQFNKIGGLSANGMSVFICGIDQAIDGSIAWNFTEPLNYIKQYDGSVFWTAYSLSTSSIERNGTINYIANRSTGTGLAGWGSLAITIDIPTIYIPIKNKKNRNILQNDILNYNPFTEYDNSLSILWYQTSGIIGNGAVTNNSDSAQVSVQLNIAGSGQSRNSNDRSQATITQTATASGAVRNSNDRASANGSIILQANAGIRNKDDSVNAIGTVTSSAIGSCSALNNDDSANASGQLLIAGTANARNKNDSSSGIISQIANGTANAVNRNDSSAGVASQTASGNAGIRNKDDSVNASGVVISNISATGTVRNNNDSAIVSGQLIVSANGISNNKNDSAIASVVQAAGVTGLARNNNDLSTANINVGSSAVVGNGNVRNNDDFASVNQIIAQIIGGGSIPSWPRRSSDIKRSVERKKKKEEKKELDDILKSKIKDDIDVESKTNKSDIYKHQQNLTAAINDINNAENRLLIYLQQLEIDIQNQEDETIIQMIAELL